MLSYCPVLVISLGPWCFPLCALSVIGPHQVRYQAITPTTPSQHRIWLDRQAAIEEYEAIDASEQNLCKVQNSHYVGQCSLLHNMWIPLDSHVLPKHFTHTPEGQTREARYV